MKELFFHPDTYIEINESYQWYESHSPGLGDVFIKELEKGFSPEERLKGLNPEKRLKGLSLDEIEEYSRKLKKQADQE